MAGAERGEHGEPVMSQSIPCAVLMCHAPVVLPEVAGRDARVVESTTHAMRDAARCVVQARPDVVVVLSPHAARHVAAWSVADGDVLAGEIAFAGAPAVRVSLPIARHAVLALEAEALRAGVPLRRNVGTVLDHGALVPLRFLAEAGWAGDTLLLAFPDSPTHPDCQAMGEAIARAAQASRRRWAIVASGDMSHCLMPGAPAGFHPEAWHFDRGTTIALEEGALHRAVEVDPSLRAIAAEDVVDSLEVASAAIGWDPRGHRILSYEGPFGVGYLVAVLHDEPIVAAREVRAAPVARPIEEALRAALRGRGSAGSPDSPGLGPALLGVARRAIEEALTGRPITLPPLPEVSVPGGIFVTLWSPGRQLRGCIGHVGPVRRPVAREVADCAVAAAMKDRRFPPVRRAELADLRIEVSFLGPLERVRSLDALDPARFGVVIAQGSHRGVLLPRLEGVSSAVRQLAIACEKGGVDPDLPFEVYRFEVESIEE